MTSALLRAIREAITEDSPPRKIHELVELQLIETMGPVDASDHSQRIALKVRGQLITLRQQAYEGEEDCWFEFNSTSDHHIQGPCFVEPNDSEDVRAAKINRLNSGPLRRALEALDFNEFELVSAALLSLLGVREVQQTSRTSDQGIDFFGRLVLAHVQSTSSPFFGLAHQLRFWIVGQAKHYVDRKVSSPEIRNLVGSINLARFKEYASTSELLKDLPLRSCDPVFALFVTTGGFTRDARRLAQNSGVILQDVNDIAKYLADRGVGVGEGPGQHSSRQLVQWAQAANKTGYGRTGLP